MQKITKNPFLGVQGRSRSSILINLKSLLPVLVIISSIYVPICNRFHTRRANSGKITSYPSLIQSFEGTPSPGGTKFRHDKLESLGAAHSEDFLILACTVLIQYSSVTNGQTDGQTPRPWLRRTKHSAIAR